MNASAVPGHSKRSAFTLVEVVVAIVLLTVGLVSTAAFMASGLRVQRLSLSRAEMTTLAEAKLEELRSYGATSSRDPLRQRIALGGSVTSDVSGYSDSVAGLDGRWYHRRWHIEPGVAGTRRANFLIERRNRNAYETGPLLFSTLLTLR